MDPHELARRYVQMLSIVVMQLANVFSLCHCSVLQILKSNQSSDELQMPLFELLGPASFEFIALLLDKRVELLETMFATPAVSPANGDSSNRGKGKGRPMPSGMGNITVRTTDDLLIDKLKRQSKKKRNKSNKGGNKGKTVAVKQSLPKAWFDEEVSFVVFCVKILRS